MKRKKTRQYTPEEKVSILRQHLLDRKPVSEICEEQELQPSVFYRWQKQFFEEGGAAFHNQNSEKTQMTKLKQKVRMLEEKLQVKNEVLSELMEEHVQLKKKNGGY